MHTITHMFAHLAGEICVKKIKKQMKKSHILNYALDSGCVKEREQREEPGEV